MKKLALIVLLAVIASRVLSESDKHPGQPPSHPRSFVSVAWNNDEPPQPPAPPLINEPSQRDHSIRSIPWHSGSSDRTDESAPPRSRLKRITPRREVHLPSAAVPESKEVPSWFPKSEQDEEKLAQPDAAGFRVLLGQVSASEDRARLDLRKIVNREISDWLAADVPPDWTPPAVLVDHMIWASRVQPVIWSLGAKPGEVGTDVKVPDGSIPSELDSLYTLYRAGQKLDFSDARRAAFVRQYQRDVASTRMKRSGSVIAVVLASLALFSLYVRTDEATKGYYTNRLRVLALAGLGAAGTVAYHYWA